mgnify:CR=1 FL=1
MVYIVKQLHWFLGSVSRSNTGIYSYCRSLFCPTQGLRRLIFWLNYKTYSIDNSVCVGSDHSNRLQRDSSRHYISVKRHYRFYSFEKQKHIEKALFRGLFLCLNYYIMIQLQKLKNCHPTTSTPPACGKRWRRFKVFLLTISAERDTIKPWKQHGFHGKRNPPNAGTVRGVFNSLFCYFLLMLR